MLFPRRLTNASTWGGGGGVITLAIYSFKCLGAVSTPQLHIRCQISVSILRVRLHNYLLFPTLLITWDLNQQYFTQAFNSLKHLVGVLNLKPTAGWQIFGIGGGLHNIFLSSLISIQCMEYSFKVLFLLLVTSN